MFKLHSCRGDESRCLSDIQRLLFAIGPHAPLCARWFWERRILRMRMHTWPRATPFPDASKVPMVGFTKRAVALAVSRGLYRLHCKERSSFYHFITRTILPSPATTATVCSSPAPRLNPVLHLAHRPRFLHVPSPHNLADVSRSQIRVWIAWLGLLVV